MADTSARSGKCAQCGAAAQKRCSKCATVWYCDRACQRKHLKAHRPACKAAAKGSAEKAAPPATLAWQAAQASARAPASQTTPPKRSMVLFLTEEEMQKRGGRQIVLDSTYLIVAKTDKARSKAQDVLNTAAINNAFAKNPDIAGASSPQVYEASTVGDAVAAMVVARRGSAESPLPDTWLAIDLEMPEFAVELARAQALWPDVITVAKVATALKSPKPVCFLLKPPVLK